VFLGVKKHAAKDHANGTFHHTTTIKKPRANTTLFPKPPTKSPAKSQKIIPPPEQKFILQI
jgi:hypothetical protein